jgi:hypothetical protein
MPAMPPKSVPRDIWSLDFANGQLAGTAEHEVVAGDRVGESRFEPLNAFRKAEEDLNAAEIANKVRFLFLAHPVFQLAVGRSDMESA